MLINHFNKNSGLSWIKRKHIIVLAVIALVFGGSASVASIVKTNSINKENAAIARKKSSQESAQRESANAKKVKDTHDDVEYLFSNYKDTELADGITSKEVSDVWDEVDALPKSKERSRLHNLVKRAMNLADKEIEKEQQANSSITSSVSSSSHRPEPSKSKYKKVSLSTFTALPDKYNQKFIQTSGNVINIQREPDNSTMDYVVIVPKGDTNASEGTVTEMDSDYVKSQSISEGDNITVQGTGLTQTVKLNGKTLETDIIVDSVSVN